MLLTTAHYAGIISTLILMSAVGIYAGRKVQSAADFATGGRKASASIVAGTIMGTLVGGASTIGTAQLAFQYGFSAWWFTLGGGIGCAILGLGMGRSLWHSSVETVPQFLAKTYGAGISPISSIFTSIGMFLSLIAQVLSFCALITAIYPLNPIMATSIGILLVLTYVLFGGVWGTGLSGIFKLILLYVAMLSCGLIALSLLGGINGLFAKFPMHPWFSLFGRGFNKDFAAGFSLIVGILSTQTYFQAILSAKSMGAANKGALLSGLFTPPIGLGGIMVGLFMRANFPGTPSSEVLPVFVMNYLPPLLAGVVLATLLISVIGTWAGLTLGISTMLTKDIYIRFFRPQADSKTTLLIQRIAIIIICIIAIFFVSGNAGSLILSWSFMAMGLRGCTVLFPLAGAILLPSRVTPKGGIAAALVGPLVNLLWKLLYPAGLDPLYPGLAASAIALILVSRFTDKPSARLPRV